jgi:hypothetical protein
MSISDTQRFQATSGLPKRTLDYNRKQGELWQAAERVLPALPCLVPLCFPNDLQVAAKEYLDLREADLIALSSLLDDEYGRGICTAAVAILESLKGRAADVDFRWEADRDSFITCLGTGSDERVVNLLQQFPSCDNNNWDYNDFKECERPKNWPQEWPWPADPTLLYDDVEQCDYCESHACRCTNSPTGLPPLIRQYGSKGRGLQAIAALPGSVAHKKGDFLGVLSGQIVPAGTIKNTTGLDFVRPDIPDKPVVCQIDVAGKGSRLRLMNHSSNPCGRFVQRKRGGRYVTAVEAIRDIMDGEEITVSYGTRWLATLHRDNDSPR